MIKIYYNPCQCQNTDNWADDSYASKVQERRLHIICQDLNYNIFTFSIRNIVNKNRLETYISDLVSTDAFDLVSTDAFDLVSTDAFVYEITMMRYAHSQKCFKIFWSK